MVTGDKPHMAFLPGAVPVEGGLPLLIDGQIYGAIGVSGMPSDKDGIVAQAGADLRRRCVTAGLKHCNEKLLAVCYESWCRSSSWLLYKVDSPSEPVYFHAFR